MPGWTGEFQSFELAFRMQMEAAEAFDVDREPRHIHELYGDGVHARQTIIARRLLERGVRYVQLWHARAAVGQPRPNRIESPQTRTRDRSADRRFVDRPQTARGCWMTRL